MNWKLLGWSYLSIPLCLAITSQAALVVDNFTTAQYLPGSLYGSAGYVLGPGILGGERDTQAYVPTVDINGSIPNHLLTYNAQPGYFGTVILDYDGYNYSTSTFNNDGLGDVDLTQGGLNDRFRFDFTAATHAGGTLTVVVQNVGFASSSISVPLPSSSGFLDVPFASFQTSGSQPVNFADAGWVRVEMQLNYGDSYTLSSIEATVPEPSAAALILAGTVALYLRNSRRCLRTLTDWR